MNSPLSRTLLAGAVLASSMALASAQAINIDIGPSSPFGSPSAAFGAASGQVGVWNGIDTPTAQAGSFPIVDVNGAATGVTLTAVAATGFGIADFSFNNTATIAGSDVEKLLDDLCDSSTSTWTFNGLTNGQYDVYVYSWAPDNRTTFFSDVSVTGGSAGVVHCGGSNWAGSFTSPAIYMMDTVLVTSGTIVVNMANPVPVTPTSINGFQLIPNGCAAPTPYCIAKPTSNGCNPVIGSSGTPSATAGNGFFVNATQMINNKNCLLFYGTTGQASVPFQGGTLCVATPIKRTPGTNTLGNPPPNDCSGVPQIDMNLFASGGLGGTPLPALLIQGTVVNCQWWGRDPGFAAPNNTQLSDGLEYTVCQ